MGYRLMQLQKEIMGRKFELIQGVNFETNPKMLGYARLNVLGDVKKPNIVTTIRNYGVKDWEDGFKDIHLYLPEENETITEEKILLIIDYIPNVKTSARRIAGRYPEEGIYVLKPGDKIEVCSKLLGNSSIATFGAIQYEGKMYLMELYN